MRIPSGSTDRKIYFVAVDATDLKTRETGLTGFTVYRSRNGGAATAMTTPTVAELDATNMPGVYSLLLDEDTTLSAGHDSEEMCYHITHASMAPVTRTVEIYRPETTEGNTLAVTASGTGGINWANVENPASTVSLSDTTIGTCTSNTDMRGTDGALLASSAPANFGDLAITATTGQVTVGTNNDKTGYELSAAGVDAIWDEAQSGHVSPGTFGAYLDAAVSSRGTGDATAANQSTIITHLTDIKGATWSAATDSLEAIRDRGDAAWVTATGFSTHSAGDIWDVVLSGHLTAGSTGAALNAAGSSGDPWATSLPGAYAAGTAGYILGNNLDTTVSSRGTGDATVTNQATMLGHLTDIKGTGFVKDTHSLPQCLTATGFSTHSEADVWTYVSRTLTDKSDFTLASSEHTAIADATLSRNVSNVEATAPEHSLCTVALAALESSVSGTTWTIKRTDGTTTHATKTVTTDANADPITGVS